MAKLTQSFHFLLNNHQAPEVGPWLSGISKTRGNGSLPARLPGPSARRPARLTACRAEPTVKLGRKGGLIFLSPDVIAPIDVFYREARKLGVPIVHVKSVLRAGGVDDVNGIPSAWRRTFPLHVGPIPNADAHAIEGSRWTELKTEVAPSDMAIAGRRRLSAFSPTDLDFLLRNQRITTIVIDGGFTDCCVLNTAFDASNHNYRVIVLRDLVRGTDEYLEDAAIAMVSLHLGFVMESAELLRAWAT